MKINLSLPPKPVFNLFKLYRLDMICSGSGTGYKHIPYFMLDHLIALVVYLVSFVEDLTFIITLGMLSWDLRAWFLFDVLAEYEAHG